MVSQNTTFFFNLSYRYLSVVVLMFDFSTYHFLCRCTIVLSANFSICFFINPSIRSVHFLRKPFFVSLSSIFAVGINGAVWKCCVNSGLVVRDRILFTAGFDCCVIRVTSHIPFCLFPVTFNICYPLFWAVIYFWYSVIVYPSLHMIPNNMSRGSHFGVNVNYSSFFC